MTDRRRLNNQSQSVPGVLSPVGAAAATASDLTWNGDGSDWDSADSESGVVHENTANTDYDDASVLKKGYPVASPLLSGNLELYVPLHEDSGTDAHDFSGGSHTGTINSVSGSVVGQTGILGTTAFDFPNSDDNVAWDTPFLPDNTVATHGGWAFSCWFNTVQDTTDSRRLMNVHDVSGASNTAFGAMAIDDGVMEIEGRDDDTSNFANTAGSTQVNDGNWHFCTVSNDTANGGDLRVYVDGSQDGSADNVAVMDGDFSWSDAQVRLGEQASSFQPYDGKIAFARIDYQPFTLSQHQTLYNVENTNGNLITAEKVSDGTGLDTLKTTSTLNDGGIDVTVYEDVGDDGAGASTDPNGKNYDNSDTVTLTGGADETNALAGLNGGSGDAYWLEVDMSTTNPTDNPATLTSATLTTGT